MKNGPIILVEDDVDDQDFLIEIIGLLNLEHEVKIFQNAPEALVFLRKTTEKPFIIISDVNLPIMNGLQLKEEIQNDEVLRKKGIPFVFLSTSADAKSVKEAFGLGIQGFFVKENSFDRIKAQLELIFAYWQCSNHPNMV